jgi:hypothetical protein
MSASKSRGFDRHAGSLNAFERGPRRVFFLFLPPAGDAGHRGLQWRAGSFFA